MESLIINTDSTKEDAIANGAESPVMDEKTGKWFSSNVSWMNAHGLWDGPVEVDGIVYPNGMENEEYD